MIGLVREEKREAENERESVRKGSVLGLNLASKLTRKLCYRKDDRAMRPIYGFPENFRDSLTMPTATFPKVFMGFCSDSPYECAYKI